MIILDEKQVEVKDYNGELLQFAMLTMGLKEQDVNTTYGPEGTVGDSVNRLHTTIGIVVNDSSVSGISILIEDASELAELGKKLIEHAANVETMLVAPVV